MQSITINSGDTKHIVIDAFKSQFGMWYLIKDDDTLLRPTAQMIIEEPEKQQDFFYSFLLELFKDLKK